MANERYFQLIHGVGDMDKVSQIRPFFPAPMRIFQKKGGGRGAFFWTILLLKSRARPNHQCNPTTVSEGESVEQWNLRCNCLFYVKPTVNATHEQNAQRHYPTKSWYS